MQMKDIPVGHVARNVNCPDEKVLRGSWAGTWLTGGLAPFQPMKIEDFSCNYEDLGPLSEFFNRVDESETGQPVRSEDDKLKNVIDEAITQQILGSRSELLPRWIRTSQGLFQTRQSCPRFVYGEGTSLELVVDSGPTHSDIIAEGDEAERLLDTLAERLGALNVRAAQVTDENGRPTVPITDIGRYRCRDGMMATIDGRIHDGNPFPWQGVRDNGCRNIWNSNGLSPVGFCDVVEYVGPCERNDVNWEETEHGYFRKT